MNQKTQLKINRILDTLDVFNPISVRLILIGKNAAGAGSNGESRIPFIRGNNNSTLETLDARFLEIMRAQTALTIPDLSGSALFSGLNLLNTKAFFYALNTLNGYVGFIWIIFRMDQDDRLVKLTESLCEWILDELNATIQSNLTTQTLANTYVEFLDNLNAPAMIYIPATAMTAANVSFESIPQKKSFFNAFRAQIRGSRNFREIAAEFQFQLIDIAFPQGKNGYLFIFKTEAPRDRFTRFDTNALEYFQLLAQKTAANLSLLEQAETLAATLKDPYQKARRDLDRLIFLFKQNERHYRNFPQPNEGAIQKTNIADILREVVSDLRTVAAKKNISLRLEIEEIEGVIVQNGDILGDPWLLTLSAYNILDNAIRYSKTGSDPIRIALSFTKNDWILEISDSGPGISPVDLDSILDNDPPDKSAAERINGLDFVKYALRIHRGKIDIKSRLGEGTSVKLIVPID